MFYTNSDRMFIESAEAGQDNQVPLHNPDDNGERPNQTEESIVSSTGSESTGNDGTWGERDIGGPVNLRHAMQDYEEMRKNLSQVSRSNTRRTERSTTSRPASRHQTAQTDASRTEDSEDIEAQMAGKDDEGEDFSLGDFLKDGHFEKRTEGQSAKKVGVVWKHLTVQGVGVTATFVKTLPDAIVGTFGPDLYRIVSRFVPSLPQLGRHGERLDLIHDFSGVVRDGEMMLVLGRPGSGCSTFLKAVTNKWDGYASVTGDVSYGGIPAAEQLKSYRGEVNYNEEDDQRESVPSLNRMNADFSQTFLL